MAFSSDSPVMRAAKVRVRAKRFANQLRSERWAESIPAEDINWIESTTANELEFKQMLDLYKETLIARSCVMRNHDFKWEAK